MSQTLPDKETSMSEEKDCVPGGSDARPSARPESPHSAGTWPGLPQHEAFTLVFSGSLRDYPRNPFLTDTPFGRPRAAGVGDALAFWDEAGRGTEWFWRIVDAEGLADLPSDEEPALRLLVQRAGRAAILEEALSTLAALPCFGCGDRLSEPSDGCMTCRRAKRVLQSAQPSEAARERSEHSTAVTPSREDH